MSPILAFRILVAFVVVITLTRATIDRSCVVSTLLTSSDAKTAIASGSDGYLYFCGSNSSGRRVVKVHPTTKVQTSVLTAGSSSLSNGLAYDSSLSRLVWAREGDSVVESYVASTAASVWSTSISLPMGIAIHGTTGDYYVTESSTVRQLSASTGVSTVLAGVTGSYGAVDGTGSAARFACPAGLVVFHEASAPYLVVADQSNSCLRKVVISTAVVTTFVGVMGSSGTVDGVGTNARCNQPFAMVRFGGSRLLLFSQNGLIRKVIMATVYVMRLAGSADVAQTTDGYCAPSGARFQSIAGMALEYGSTSKVWVVEKAQNAGIRAIIIRSFTETMSPTSTYSVSLSASVRLTVSPSASDCWELPSSTLLAPLTTYGSCCVSQLVRASAVLPSDPLEACNRSLGRCLRDVYGSSGGGSVAFDSSLRRWIANDTHSSDRLRQACNATTTTTTTKGGNIAPCFVAYQDCITDAAFELPTLSVDRGLIHASNGTQCPWQTDVVATVKQAREAMRVNATRYNETRLFQNCILALRRHLTAFGCAASRDESGSLAELCEAHVVDGSPVLTSAVIGGIAAACAVVILATVGIVIVCVVRHRRRKDTETQLEEATTGAELDAEPAFRGVGAPTPPPCSADDDGAGSHRGTSHTGHSEKQTSDETIRGNPLRGS